jgi:hypothetical protein
MLVVDVLERVTGQTFAQVLHSAQRGSHSGNQVATIGVVLARPRTGVFTRRDLTPVFCAKRLVRRRSI